MSTPSEVVRAYLQSGSVRNWPKLWIDGIREEIMADAEPYLQCLTGARSYALKVTSAIPCDSC